MIILEESHNGEVIVYEANKNKLKDIVITKLCEQPDYKENYLFEDKLYNYSVDFKTFKIFDNYTDLWEFKKSILNATNTKIPNEIIKFINDMSKRYTFTFPCGQLDCSWLSSTYSKIFDTVHEAEEYCKDVNLDFINELYDGDKDKYYRDDNSPELITLESIEEVIDHESLYSKCTNDELRDMCINELLDYLDRNWYYFLVFKKECV